MNDIIQFLRAVWSHWIAKMCGIFALCWWFASLFAPIPPWVFGVLCILALVWACFLAWRDEHREARPYEQETLSHVRQRFLSLTDDQKGALKRLVISRSAPPEGILGSLEPSGLVSRDPVTANYKLSPEFALIVAKLVKEWQP